MDNITFVGLDVHKATVCVAVAESGRGGSAFAAKRGPVATVCSAC